MDWQTCWEENDRLAKQLDSWTRWYGEGTNEAPHVADARQEERERAAGMVEEEAKLADEEPWTHENLRLRNLAAKIQGGE